jgi:hypothetical protein
MQSRRGGPVPQPTNNPSAACSRWSASVWTIRCSPTHGIHEHPTREQDRHRDPPSIIGRASTCPTSPAPLFSRDVSMIELSRRSHRLVRRVARTPPRIRPEKGRQVEGRVRASLPHGHGGRRAPSRRAASAYALRLPLRLPRARRMGGHRRGTSCRGRTGAPVRDGHGDCEASRSWRRHRACAAAGTDYHPRGSTCFAHDVTLAQPFVETRVDAHGREHSMVVTDCERLVTFVRAVSRPFFLLLKSSILRLTF